MARRVKRAGMGGWRAWTATDRRGGEGRAVMEDANSTKTLSSRSSKLMTRQKKEETHGGTK